MTAGDCVAAIIQLLAGDAFLSETSFAVQGALVALSGVAFVVFRRRIIALMGDVR